MHMLPVLGALAEKRAGQPLAIIGVHSAKFDNEKVPSHVRAAVARYGIDHPVVVDNDMAIWDRYGVQAWPTLVLIRPNGHIAGAVPGEVTLGMLDHAVKEIMADAKADGTLGTTQLLPPHVAKPDPGLLAYPGKVIAAPDGRIFLSDSRHHRVLELGHDGRVIDIIGSGELGRQAGPFATAQLDDPQGLAFDRGAERLYIADGRGQTIWKADLRGKTLTVLAGSGKLGSSHFAGDEEALGAELRTPWDLALAGQKLYVAMAGAHQLAVIDLGHGTIAGFAGNGRETLVDGSGPFSSFAQPSGLAIGMLRPAASARQPAEPASSDDGETMYVADSESSAIRAVDLRSGADAAAPAGGSMVQGRALDRRQLQQQSKALQPGDGFNRDGRERRRRAAARGPGGAGGRGRRVAAHRRYRSQPPVAPAAGRDRGEARAGAAAGRARDRRRDGAGGSPQRAQAARPHAAR
jgi:sugar lactone lactonase YvrE